VTLNFFPSGKRISGSAVLLFVFLLAGTACQPRDPSEDAIFQLKLGHDQSTGHPYDQGVRRFAQAVEAATEGAVKITVYPSSQLGDTPEQIEGLRMGALDLSLAAFSHVSQFVPELGIFSAPFLFDDARHFAAVFNGEIGADLDRISQSRYDIRLLATLYSGHRILFNSRRPVQDVDDVAGLKIRVMAGEADAATWKAFGAIPSPMPYSEVYSALQAGVIDGAENEPVSILTNKFYETCPYFAITEHLILPMGLFMSTRVMDRLPEEYRTILVAEARKAADWERDHIQQQNRSALQLMEQKYGARVAYPDKSGFLTRAAPIQARLAQKWGLEDLLEKIQQAGSAGN